MRKVLLLGFVVVGLVGLLGTGQEEQASSLNFSGTQITVANALVRLVQPGDLLRISFDITARNASMRIKSTSIQTELVAFTEKPLSFDFGEDAVVEHDFGRQTTRIADSNAINYPLPDEGILRLDEPNSEIDVTLDFCNKIQPVLEGNFEWSRQLVTNPRTNQLVHVGGSAEADGFLVIVKISITSENDNAALQEVLAVSVPFEVPERCARS